MLPFSVISAIGIASVVVLHGMVHHFPDTSAHQIVITIDFLPVCFRVSRANPHRMRIFAEEIWSVIQALLFSPVFPDHMHLRHGRIHFAADIICLSLAVDRTLVVHGERRALFQIVVHGIRVAVTTGFIPQRPHDNRRIAMQLIPLIEMFYTVEIMPAPFGIMADGIVGGWKLMRKGTVSLQIVFIHKVNAQLIRQLQKKRIRRIMGGANGIDVILFAEQQIPFNFIRCHGIAVGRTRIMMIDAVELNPAAINQENVSLNRDCSEADPFRYTAVLCLIADCIEHRLLCIPLFYL